MRASRSILILGAGGVIGPSMMRLLAREDRVLYALSRRDRGDQTADRIRWLRGDLEQGVRLPAGIDVAVHAAPLWLLPASLEVLAAAGISRLLAFSSTSAVSKVESSEDGERDVARRLTDSEDACRHFCRHRGLALTLFRPTMIYGYRRDHNIMAIARFIHRFGFFPVAGQARGRRQPVHADELALACVDSLDESATYGRDYALSGGETLTYVDMVKRIFVGMKRTQRILSLPLGVYRAALKLLDTAVAGGRYSPAMAARMQQDLCFDHRAAQADFGYAPGAFLTDPKRDLPVD